MDERETFKADQLAAAEQEQDRDRTSWELNVRMSEANASIAEGQAAHQQARAAYWRALGSTVTLVRVLLAIAIVYAVCFAFGWRP